MKITYKIVGILMVTCRLCMGVPTDATPSTTKADKTIHAPNTHDSSTKDKQAKKETTDDTQKTKPEGTVDTKTAPPQPVTTEKTVSSGDGNTKESARQKIDSAVQACKSKDYTKKVN